MGLWHVYAFVTGDKAMAYADRWKRHLEPHDSVQPGPDGIAIRRYVVAETEDAATSDAMDKINRAFPECTVQHRQTIAVAERGPR